ncbi:DUF4783 domain-containing protein [soil metagenome]
MRIVISLLLLVFTLTSFRSGNLNEVIWALKQGNASQLSKFFDRTVDVSLGATRNTYSSGQAELILKEFFSANKVITFVLIHKKESNGAGYCIGSMQTTSGTYRTSVFLKQKGDKDVIQELRIER